jgi:hypothetical protein
VEEKGRRMDYIRYGNRKGKVEMRLNRCVRGVILQKKNTI